MIDVQCEKLKAIKDRQEEILGKQVAEAEEKANRLYMEKERRLQEMRDQIERSRQQ